MNDRHTQLIGKKLRCVMPSEKKSDASFFILFIGHSGKGKTIGTRSRSKKQKQNRSVFFGGLEWIEGLTAKGQEGSECVCVRTIPYQTCMLKLVELYT